MTDKQKRFCDEYIFNGNATAAAIKAGYSAKTAYAIGGENLKKPELKFYIDAELKKIHSKKIADAEEVLEYLTSVMRGEQADNIDTPIRDRLKAAELLGKRYRLFSDGIKLEGNIPIVISGADQLED